MPRPKSKQPTPGELEVLKVLWDRGPSTVREVMGVLNERRRRAYTSVMSLLEVMTEKGLLRRRPQGRAFNYEAKTPREKTLGRLVQDLVDRAFHGSTGALVAHLLDQSDPSPQELDEIRNVIDQYRRQQGSDGCLR